eukprot:9004070-Pyramimonas_sp.AAC.2
MACCGISHLMAPTSIPTQGIIIRGTSWSRMLANVKGLMVRFFWRVRKCQVVSRYVQKPTYHNICDQVWGYCVLSPCDN